MCFPGNSCENDVICRPIHHFYSVRGGPRPSVLIQTRNKSKHDPLHKLDKSIIPNGFIHSPWVFCTDKSCNWLLGTPTDFLAPPKQLGGGGWLVPRAFKKNATWQILYSHWIHCQSVGPQTRGLINFWAHSTDFWHPHSHPRPWEGGGSGEAGPDFSSNNLTNP